MIRFLILLLFPVSLFGQTASRATLRNTISYLVSIDDIPSVRVPNGTAFGDINFSDYNLTTVNGLLSDGTFVDLPITWQQGTYNSAVSTTYTLDGVFSASINTNNIVPQIDVEVVTLETEYQTLLTTASGLGYTLPSPISQGNENRLMVTVKTLSFDVFYNFMTDGDSDYATLDWISPGSNQITKVSSPTFTPRSGFTGNGTSSYLNTNYNPSTQGVNFTLNSAGFGCYINSKSGNSGTAIGQVASGARNNLSVGEGGGSFYLNNNTNQSYVNYFAPGFFHCYRTSSTSSNIYKNACSIATGLTGTTVARPSNNVYLLSRNNAGTADVFGTQTISMAWFGATLSASIDTFYQAWFTFLNSQRVKPVFGSSVALGTVLNDSFARSTLGINYDPTGTWVPNGTLLPITGGSNTFTLRCRYFYGQSSQNATQSTAFTLAVAPSATTYGMGIGWSDFSSPDQERTIAVKLDLTNTANSGKVFIYTWDGSSAVTVGTSAAALTVNNGDQFTLSVTKSIVGGVMRYAATATDITGGGSATINYDSFLGDSSGDFSLFNFGGTINITNYTITINEQTNKSILTVGNSLTYGAFASTITQGYAYNINSSYNVSGGPGDYTQTSTRKLRSLTDLNAKYYLVMIGGNDVAGGVSAGTYQNNHKQLVRSIRNEGYRVIVLYVPPRNDGDVTALNSFIAATYTDLTVINGYTVLEGLSTKLKTIYDFGDGVHWNTAGHSIEAATIKAAMPVLYSYGY
jgi:lysophospholipase L1-like esterase